MDAKRRGAARGGSRLALAILLAVLAGGVAGQTVVWQRDVAAPASFKPNPKAVVVNDWGLVGVAGEGPTGAFVSSFTVDGHPVAVGVADARDGNTGPIDRPLAMVTQDGPAYILGEHAPSCTVFGCDIDPWLRRYDVGARTWSVNPPGTWVLQGLVAAPGGVYVMGNDAAGPLFARFQATDGGLAWVRSVPRLGPTARVNAMAGLPDGGVVTTASDGFVMYVRRHAPNGDAKTTTPLPASTLAAGGLAVDADGVVYVAGTRTSPGLAGVQYWVARIEPDGTIAWLDVQAPAHAAFAGASGGATVRLDGAGRPVVNVTTRDADPIAAEILAYDADGTLRWRSPLPAPDTFGPGMAVDRRGNVYVGMTLAGSANVRRLSPRGTLLWTATLPGLRDPLLAVGGTPEALMVAASVPNVPGADAAGQLLRIAIGPDEPQPAVDVPAVAPALLAMLAVVLGIAGAVRLRAPPERGGESR